MSTLTPGPAGWLPVPFDTSSLGDLSSRATLSAQTAPLGRAKPEAKRDFRATLSSETCPVPRGTDPERAPFREGLGLPFPFATLSFVLFFFLKKSIIY